MKNFISRVRTILPVKAFFALILGGLLLVSQACSSVTAATPYSDKSNTGTKTTHPYNDDGKTESKRANLYKDDGPNSELRVPKGANINSPYEGGMNNYSDVDPRSKAAIDKTKTEAKYLTENAKRNLANSKESLADVAERAASNVKENAKNAADNVKSTFKDVRSDVNDSLKDNTKKVNNSLDDASDYIQSKADRDIRTTKRALDKTGDAIKDTVE